MAVAQGPFLAAVLLLVFSGLHCSSPLPACPEPCTCQRAPLLNCSSSGLSLVPQHIQDSVTELDLSHNLLNSVTLDWPHHNLRNVWLGNNNITHLSLCIERNPGGGYVRGRHPHRLRPWSRQGCVSWAPTLQLLSVERNQLEQLPEGLEGSESLQVLQLSFNRISTLQPGDLGHLQQLRELHLQHNLISSLHPQMFQDLAQLQVLDLSFNRLTNLHPLMYLSLRNIGADVRLGGNSWQCDCRMRSLRRRMAYDSNRGLQAWSVVCTSPSILTDRDLLQLEEDDLNCAENRPELHQDVTVYSGSDILLSCSTQDSAWWTPNGRASVSQPQAGLLISDITEEDTGLYVCISEENNVLSVFNLQISKIGGTRRKTISLPRTRRQIIPQDTPNSFGQERNQRATPCNLALAVCLSVFITFLVAFVLGVLARPYIDRLWKRVRNKKSSPEANSVTSVEQRQYDNEAYYSSEEQEEIVTRRERRVTFSTVDTVENGNVQYYDTVASGDQESLNNDAVTECEVAKVEKYTHKAEDSGSENSLRQRSPEENKKDGRDLSGVTNAGRRHNTEFEYIPDPDELERRSSSSSSDSSISDKVFNQDQMTQRDLTTPTSPQLAEDSVQQTADFLAARKAEVPQFSIGSEIPEFSSEPFADWSPHSKNLNLIGPDMWQENEEQFEFSDSVQSTSPRSSSVYGSFNDPKLIVAPNLDEQKKDDMSSSSSYVSEDEPTEYTVNPDQEEVEEAIERNHDKADATNASLEQIKQDANFPQQIHPFMSSVGFNQGDYRYDTERHAVGPRHSTSSDSSDSNGGDFTVTHKGEGNKMSSGTVTEELDTRKKVEPMPRTKWSSGIIAPLPASDSSSSDESTDETSKHKKRHEQGDVDMAEVPIKEYQSASCDGMKPHITPRKRRAPLPPTDSSVSHDSEKQWPSLDLEHIPCIKRHLDIKAPSPVSDSSSGSDSEDETTGHIKKQEQELKYLKTVSDVRQTQWPALDLDHTTRIKRRLDIKAPSPDSDSSSSSNSEDEATGHIEKQRPGKVDIVGLPFEESQTASHYPDTKWPSLDLEHTTRIKRRLDIKAPSPDSCSSSSSDSEDEATGHIEKQRPGKVDIAGIPFKDSKAESHDPDTKWPALDLEHTTHVKRRLDIKAPSPDSDSSSSSDGEDETTNQLQKHKQVEVQVSRLPFKETQAESHDPDTTWPALDLEHTTRIKRRLDIKAPSPDSSSSSSSDSEDEATGHVEKQKPGKVDIAVIPFKESKAESHDPDTMWPALDLEHTTHIKRRLDIKAPLQASDSPSSSDSEDETTGHIKKQEQGEMCMARPSTKVSQTVSDDRQTRWPALDLEHTTHVKRRLDIKAPSPDSDSPSSSSSDSEGETTGHIKKQEQGETCMTNPPTKVSQTVSDDRQTQWPALDLDHTTRIKRRLDIRAPSPDSSSSSSSDSEDEATGHIEKQRPGKVDIAGIPFKESKAESHDPDTKWPALDLENTTHVKRRLDIKAPSPDSDSSSSSDSEDEATGHIEKQRPGKVDNAVIPFKESKAESHDPDTKWPALDLEHTTHVKRRLDIKAPSPDSDSSSSSDGEDETTNQLQKHKQVEVQVSRLPFKETQAESHDPDTTWPALDLEHTTRIKRRLDIKAPSPDPDSPSSSSSDSEDETTNQLQKHKQVEVQVSRLPFKESQSESHNPDTKWPVLDLEHTTRIKRRLDIKAPSPDSDSPSSSSSDSEDETTGHINKQEQGGTCMVRPPTVSKTVSDDRQTQWPALDLEYTSPIKRRLDIKTPSPDSDSSSSSDSEEETTAYIEKQRPGKVDIAGIPFKESIAESHDPDIKWPALDLEDTTRIKRRLDIKAPSPASDSSSCSDSEDETTDHIKKREQGQTCMVRPPIKGSQTPNDDPQTQWPALDLERTTRIEQHLDIKAPSPNSDSSSSSDSENETTGHIKMQRPGKVDTAGLPFQESQKEHHDPDTRWPARELEYTTRIKRRLDIKAPQPDPILSSVCPGSQQSESNSSSDSDNENRGHKPGLGVSVIPMAMEKKFIRSPQTLGRHMSHSPKTDHNIKLEKYTVITDDLVDKTSSDNISTTPEMNTELESKWATMNLGISRFRKRLEITSRTQEPPNLSSTPPPDSPSSSSSENETGNKNSRARRKRGGILHTQSLQLSTENKPLNAPATPTLQQQSNSSSSSENDDATAEPAGKGWRGGSQLPVVTDKEASQIHSSLYVAPAVNIKLDQSKGNLGIGPQRKSSSSSNSENETIDHSVPGLRLGVPLVKRRLNVKAPSPGTSTSPSSCSENENEVTGYTAKQTIHTSDKSGMTDDDSVITYKRLIFKAQEGPSHTVGGSNASLSPVRVPSMTFDDVVKKRIEQSRHATDLDLPSEIRWTGIGRQLYDTSISPPRRHPDVGLSTPQPASPGEPGHLPLDFSNYSISKSDDKIKQDKGKADRTLVDEHSSLSVSSVPLASSKFLDNPPGSTDTILGAVSKERKGLSALKAMSAERQKWDTDAEILDTGATPPFDEHGPQVDTSFNYQRSEEIKPLAKQPLAQLHFSSSSIDERTTDSLYGIPRYRGHDMGSTKRPQEAPSPIQAPPPPYEAVGRTWRSPQSTKKQGLEGTRSYRQQGRNTENYEPSSITTQNLADIFDYSNNISHV